MEKVSSYTGAMFDKLDKLKTAAIGATVTAYCATKSAVGAVSALIGNPLTKDYEVGRHIASFGPNLAWKVLEGKTKTTGQEASIFVFEKRLLDTVDKQDRQTVLECMKKGAVQLTRLRHPRILMIQHPLEESKDCLAFATEPVFASLANLLGRHEHMPTPPPPEFASFELYEVERVYGLYQLVEGLMFLHNDAKILQGCLSPENIMVTKNGHWKISGLFFSSMPSMIDGQSSYNGCQWEPRLYPFAQPDLNYAAPEYILSRSCDVSSDMYSLGVLIYAIFNKGQTPYSCDNNMAAFKRNVEQMSKHSVAGLGDVPQELHSHVTRLLSMTPSLRPDVHEMTKISYFENVAALTLQYLDSLMQRDDMAKAQFFKSLYKIMSKLPKRVIVQRVLPQLCLQFSNHKLVPFVLPNVLLITEDCTAEEYTKLVLPELKPVFKIQEPVQVTIIFLKKLDLLLSKTPHDSIRDDVLPMVFRALEATTTDIQEMVLNVIPNFAPMVEYTLMKNSVIPRIKTLCLQTSSLAVRVNSLVCIGKVLEHLDKYYVMEDILPFLSQIPSREAPTLMGILGIYKQTMVHTKLGMDKDYLAMKAIPFLFPLSVEPSLNLKQFTQFMAIINDMINQVQVEHKAKLEQLQKMQEQTQSSLKFAQEAEEAKALDNLTSLIDKAFNERPSSTTVEEKKSIGSPSTSAATKNAEFNKLFGLSDSRGSLNEDILDAFDMSASLSSSNKPRQSSSSPSFSPKQSPQTNRSLRNLSPSPSSSTSQLSKPSYGNSSNLASTNSGGASMTGSSSMGSLSSSSNTGYKSTSSVGGMVTRSNNMKPGVSMATSSSNMSSMSRSGVGSGTFTSMPANLTGMGSMSINSSSSYGNRSSNYGNMSSSHGNMSGNNMMGSHGNMSGSYGNMSTSHSNTSTSLSNTPSNYGNMSSNYGNMSSNYGNMSSNYGNMSNVNQMSARSIGSGIMTPATANQSSMPQSSSGQKMWTPASGVSRTDVNKKSTPLDSLYSPEMSHLQSKGKPSLSSLQAQNSVVPQQSGLGMTPMRPPYAQPTMTPSGMFPMQQQGMMGSIMTPQNQFNSTPRGGSSSANDLKDIFG
ncbi:SCY1-like protein 2 [Exaiptasia diaphana]|uniref:Protein kinase domain-containing protein n=1 Tax=Exaiptasia diaphana TaxID=2652724 RepID=A0A913X669_EXADI|nr:SCY1-like protein 2 [Exaiptasia diaphana]KXJ26994.1 SCY1-like protein 2 [Exaiptasia diaphana]